MNIKQLKKILQEELATAPVVIKGDCASLAFNVIGDQLIIEKSFQDGEFHSVDSLLRQFDSYDNNLQVVFKLIDDDGNQEIKPITGAIYMADPICIGLDY